MKLKNSVKAIVINNKRLGVNSSSLFLILCNMKLLLIYDIHGQSNLIPTEQEIESVDFIVFGGDYLDSFDIHPSTQYRVLERIIDIKKKYGDKVILLLGNHDIQYLYDKRVSELKCSGFNSDYFLRFNILLKHNAYLFQYAWQHDNHLFTHAGVGSKLIESYSKKRLNQYQMVLDGEITLADLINDCKIDELYNIGKCNGGHELSSEAGIFWIRPKYLDAYPAEGYIQHVGHTNVDFITDEYMNSNTLNYYDGLGKTIIYL